MLRIYDSVQGTTSWGEAYMVMSFMETGTICTFACLLPSSVVNSLLGTRKVHDSRHVLDVLR